MKNDSAKNNNSDDNKNKNIKQALNFQEALQDKEVFLQAITDSARDAILMMNPKGQISYWNLAAESILGYTEAEALGQDLHELISPRRYQAQFQKKFPQFQRSGQGDAVGKTLELEAYCQDGTQITVELSLSSVHIQGGWHAVGILRDITERKKAERDLQESRQRLKDIINFLPDATFAIDTEGKIIIWNKAIEVMTGRKAEDMLGMSDFEHSLPLYGEGRPCLADMINEPQLFSEQGYPWIKKLEDGSLVSENFCPSIGESGAYVWAKAAPICDLQGRAIGAIEVIRDISDRKQVEESLGLQLNYRKMIADISTSFVDLSWEDTGAAINRAIELSGKVFDVDRSYIFKFADDGSAMNKTHEWCAKGVKSKIDKTQNYPANKVSWLAQQLRKMQYIHMPDVDMLPSEAAADKKEIKLRGSKSFLAVPFSIKNDGFANGFIGFETVSNIKIWTNEQISLLKILAEIISSAFAKSSTEKALFDSEERYRQKSLELEKLNYKLNEEMNKAKEIHERTLPAKLPDIAGVSFAAYYNPAQKVGGDFYNIIQVGKKVVIYLSDVTGHGLDSAMLSVFVKNAINSYISLSPADNIKPGKILKHEADRYNQENYLDDYFVCIFIAVLDLDTNQLTYTGAGFQIPLLAKLGNGDKVVLTSEGLPISSAYPIELLNFSESQVKLDVGSIAMFSTDGLFEHVVDNKTFGEKAEKVFYENCQLHPEKIIEKIIAEFKSFNNGSLEGDDDITFLIIQV